MYPGLIMNFIAIAVITLMINTLGVAIFDLDVVPSWVNSTITT